ncbi:rhamnan synthesis F family protein [Teichococcus oryzae]|uniref:Glycosyltransferase n=1 Tax=Teichococcus oryzae TaxID=1608942 RepID=A0A5B2TBX3_9PROT|nr:rhamnan synthesis F family protein [Pseudoroseomonas oryzae]KAA2212006.1 glycosyltransferase [Pseudoroseomonas oryzae]
MNLISELMPAGEISSGTADFLRASGIFDEAFYRRLVELPAEEDAALHYLQHGWKHGLEPNDSFSGSFLQPFYASCGYDGPPALSWADLCALGGARLPTNAPEAEAQAFQLRSIPLFDADHYARLIPVGLDPALHYVLIGERLGLRPSTGFDPAFYGECYPDLIAAGMAPLQHYWFHGRHEGRRCLAAADRLEFPPLPAGDTRPVVLVVSHEASRTGAPVLGWNIVRHLARDYQVVSVMMHSGPLEADFAAAAAVQVGPMQRSEWEPAQARRMAERLVREYRPLYAVTNSIETHLMVPALARFGVPSVSLVHEFMIYTGQAHLKMADIYHWAPEVIFPARIVAQSSYDNFYILDHRSGISVIPQGQAELPSRPDISASPEEAREAADRLRAIMRPEGEEDAFVVLGVGTVEIRKGVDLFVSTAATLRRMHPELRFRFVWIGGNFQALGDTGFCTFLADQMARSRLEGSVVMIEPVADLEPAYAAADAFFMCSRLDPQPNVGIDAVTRGIPTLCFESACGTGEVLAADPATRHLVVPYLDVHAAASVLGELARNREDLPRLRCEVARVGRETFDMARYVAAIDARGRDAADPRHAADRDRLIEAAIIDPDLVQPPGAPELDNTELALYAMRQWSLWNVVDEPHVTSPLRRPCAGFHPQAYAQAHPEVMRPATRDPVAHWLERGRPAGRWSHPVYSPLRPLPGSEGASPLRIALHSHFHYVDVAPDLAWRLSCNRSACDLFLTTGTEENAEILRRAFRQHRGAVDIRIVPNRGRDIGPFLTMLRQELASGGYDVFGHVHGKKTLVVGGGIGDAWRNFLWENLIGGQHPMLDLAAAAFVQDSGLGLLMAEDPHLVGWDKNRDFAEDLARRMDIPLPLDDFFDFPIGTMFWARPAALRPLLDLGLGWDDYPEEPVPYDGTILHALERLMPFVIRRTGHGIGGLRVPGTNW